MKQYSGIRLFLRVSFSVGMIGFSIFSSVSKAEEWRPKSGHFHWREVRQECSLFQSVISRTQETLENRTLDLKAVSDSTQSSFKDLNECLKKKGLSSRIDWEKDPKTAQWCPETFDAWLTNGSHLMTLEEEIGKLKTEVSSLQGALSRKCGLTMIAQK